MKHTSKHFKACDICYKQKIKCVKTTHTNCVACHRRNTTCKFSRIPKTHNPPTIQTLLREPEDNHLNLLARLLDYRVISWNLDPSVPKQVLSFLQDASKESFQFYLSTISEMLNEPDTPENFPLVILAIQRSLTPPPTRDLLNDRLHHTTPIPSLTNSPLGTTYPLSSLPSTLYSHGSSDLELSFN
ncbi:hypothetical protein DSO57_1009856 [Entomophthora muscae]|uniref:Uncharacterized protein n=1 Tax=Entomophthora muscae TaxID=34485 RepID=A0ACC2SJE8_9FUNG|nr:hypothetical protein DSO57_1009856 [Entomophthora muscae]